MLLCSSVDTHEKIKKAQESINIFVGKRRFSKVPCRWATQTLVPNTAETDLMQRWKRIQTLDHLRLRKEECYRVSSEETSYKVPNTRRRRHSSQRKITSHTESMSSKRKNETANECQQTSSIFIQDSFKISRTCSLETCSAYVPSPRYLHPHLQIWHRKEHFLSYLQLNDMNVLYRNSEVQQLTSEILVTMLLKSFISLCDPRNFFTRRRESEREMMLNVTIIMEQPKVIHVKYRCFQCKLEIFFYHGFWSSGILQKHVFVKFRNTLNGEPSLLIEKTTTVVSTTTILYFNLVSVA